MRVDGLLGELAEFQARRLDFLIATRATLLEVCEILYNPEGATTTTHLPQRVHFLDLSFPRKNANLKKKFRTRLIRPATRCTAAVFHLNWRTSRVHPKEGRPRATISHESRPGKPPFCTFDVRTRILVQL